MSKKTIEHKFKPKYSDKFINGLKNRIKRGFADDKNYPIEETHRIIDRYFREKNLMSRVRTVEGIIDEPAYKCKKFSDLFKEQSSYENTMKYIRQRSMIDDSGKWIGTSKYLVQIFKTLHQNGRFKKGIPKTTNFIQFVSKNFFLTTVDENTVKHNDPFERGPVFDL